MAPGTSRANSAAQKPSSMHSDQAPPPRKANNNVHTFSDHMTNNDLSLFQAPSAQIPAYMASSYGQFTPEEMISNSESQLKNPEQATSLSRGISEDTAYSANNETNRPQLAHSYSYDSQSNRFGATNEDQKRPSTAKSQTEKKTKGNSTSQANDQELRRLFSENCHRDLRDVAASVLASEGTTRIEKTKQIFAMNWLSLVCKKSTTSVPRNRVYAQYAQRCGTERVPLLNPASFGKLVRIIFPDITTRRLGMRGESKYHYVDLALVTDELESPEIKAYTFQGDRRTQSSARDNSQGDTAAFPPPDIPFEPHLPKLAPMPKRQSTGHLFLDRTTVKAHEDSSRDRMISRQLKFPASGNDPGPDESPIDLPEIRPYLPAATDLDTAASLQALYRSHCISIIDCVRYCKEKTFWHHFSSFHGTLTVPVQKLFSHPDLAAWIRECDWLMYQKMIQFVSPLALQVIPELVIKAFQGIADGLGRHILHVFSSHPQHVRDAKHGPAVIFAGLLNRLVRVNSASHAAAHILGNDATREQMWADWVINVKPASIAETCLPGVGYSRCIQILASEVRALLSPLSMTVHQGMQQIYQPLATESADKFSHYNILDDGSTSSVLDRWITFLHKLPARFPNADARTLLHCVSDVGTAALRDITMATAVSFGQWTVTKVWVDEMMQWLAEKGGFLENPPQSSEMRPKKRSATEAGFTTAVSNVDPLEQRGSKDRHHWRDRSDPSEAIMQRRHSMQAPHDNPLISEDRYGGSSRVEGTAAGDSLQKERTDNEPRAQQVHMSTSGFKYHPFAEDQESQYKSQAIYSDKEAAQSYAVTAKTHRSSPRKGASPWRSQAVKDFSFDENNEDSGIGLELDLPRQQNFGMVEYGGFVNNTNSDPPDVVVC